MQSIRRLDTIVMDGFDKNTQSNCIQYGMRLQTHIYDSLNDGGMNTIRERLLSLEDVKRGEKWSADGRKEVAATTNMADSNPWMSQNPATIQDHTLGDGCRLSMTNVINEVKTCDAALMLAKYNNVLASLCKPSHRLVKTFQLSRTAHLIVMA
uniref:Uncharacterized protein n=1 Tax=Glossina austeni TaxID=7395 RepID=A0A1A9V539_GLOAU